MFARSYRQSTVPEQFTSKRRLSARSWQATLYIGSVCFVQAIEMQQSFAQSSPVQAARAPQDKGSDGAVEIGRYDRPSGPKSQSRSVVVASKGMACTSDPRASAAAIEILQQGGTAVDAAIAANAVLGVVEPMSCGIGGDLYSIVWDSNTQELSGLNASGRAPASLSRQVFEEKNLKEIPLYGPMSWSVPGCVAGWFDLHAKHGKLPMRQILSRAIKIAEEGFPVSPVISGYWAKTEQKYPPFARLKATISCAMAPR
jgi:gamma-glutamyltranspeptidase